MQTHPSAAPSASALLPQRSHPQVRQTDHLRQLQVSPSAAAPAAVAAMLQLRQRRGHLQPRRGQHQRQL
jgi:hypothetical protein